MKNSLSTISKTTALCLVLSLVGLTACNEYSANSYAPADMQQVSKIDKAVVKSFRQVDVNDPSLGLGTVAGGVAGGVAGAQIGNGKGAALAAVGGALIGAGVGALADHEASKTTAYEYMLEKSNGDLISLAQKEEQPLPVGMHVLVIYGVHARIVPDNSYSGQ